jgi:hypothetical protein
MLSGVSAGATPGLMGPIAVKSRNRQTSPVTVAIRHDPQERTTLATRVPRDTACFRKLFGNGFDFVLGHIRFFRYGPRKLKIHALGHVPGKRNACQHIEN